MGRVVTMQRPVRHMIRGYGLGAAAGDVITYNNGASQISVVSVGSGPMVHWNTGGNDNISFPVGTVLRPIPSNGYLYTLGSDGFLTSSPDSVAAGTSPVTPASSTTSPAPSALVTQPAPIDTAAQSITVQTAAPAMVQAGQIFHYTGYQITIQQAGSGGPGGLMTDEGVQLPIGTIYVINENGEVWQTTGPNTALQIVTQSSGAASSTAPDGSGSAAAAPASWFSGTTSIFGTDISNTVLLGVGALAALALMNKKR